MINTVFPFPAARTAAPTEAPLHYGNSGMAFDTLAEAEAWALDYMDDALFNHGIAYKGWTGWQMANGKYTVDFY